MGGFHSLRALHPFGPASRVAATSSGIYSATPTTIHARHSSGTNVAWTSKKKSQPGFVERGRRAMRKGGDLKPIKLGQIELENTNGPPNLPTISKLEVGPLLRNSAIAFSSGEKSISKVFGLPLAVYKDSRLLSQPFSVIRGVTLRSYGWMDKASKTPSRDTRIVLAGIPGCGKSVTLLQMVEYCASKGWIVFYVPRASNWVNSSSAYQYDAQSRIFQQPTLAKWALKRLSAFNESKLNSVTTSEDFRHEKKTIVSGSSILSLIALGIQDPSAAPRVLEFTLAELQKMNTPVLVAIDDFQALYQRSLYKDPLFNNIPSHALSMPRLMLEYASGVRSFRRGAVVGSLCMTNTDFHIPYELRDALGLTPDFSLHHMGARNQAYVDFSKGLQAAAMTEVWEHGRALHSKLTESLFLAKLAESSGNPREFLHRGLWSSVVTW
ncbi:mitochondrial ribosomal death-associated protein 3-domain-containing protein [Cantharellus anzutake]|uniref:mitochondrial ribosomal death-associated protein 3-domain-containing protein n=1 Tax=Cantharellus anzutake TaxID=1750568 RepID=UPI0019067FAE|nr:mitochondrial ribosomal death-associated protein 3-domain-containing protein [Cantharellus anzutake]KAF8324333.1 mitochondrial ribosomal death-associated protein 3-domain-containing protein [Cantharellus anzutake]